MDTWNHNICDWLISHRGLPGGSDSKESVCNEGDEGSIPGSGRSPEEWKWQPTPVFLPEESMDRGTWQATVHKITRSRTRLSNHHLHLYLMSLSIMFCRSIHAFQMDGFLTVLRLSNIPFYICITFSLCVHQSMGTLLISITWLF